MSIFKQYHNLYFKKNENDKVNYFIVNVVQHLVNKALYV